MRANGIYVLLGVLAAAVVVPRPEARAASPLVSIEAVTVEPPSPAPGTLCTLSVRLKNSGTQTASSFRFKVKIDGRDEATYANVLYAVNVEPASTGTIRLNSFWSPSAVKTSFAVEVTVAEAVWAEVKREGTTTTTTPVGPVPGLPVSAAQSVSVAAGK
jgi:hypothetical protein